MEMNSRTPNCINTIGVSDKQPLIIEDRPLVEDGKPDKTSQMRQHLATFLPDFLGANQQSGFPW